MEVGEENLLQDVLSRPGGWCSKQWQEEVLPRVVWQSGDVACYVQLPPGLLLK